MSEPTERDRERAERLCGTWVVSDIAVAIATAREEGKNEEKIAYTEAWDALDAARKDWEQQLAEATMKHGNSLYEFIAAAIDEVLPPGCQETGRSICMRGFERYEQYQFEKKMKRETKELGTPELL